MKPDFFLERFLHNLLSDDSTPARRLVSEALADGTEPSWLLANILWPAAECTQQLRHAGLISQRPFNSATQTLGSIAGRIHTGPTSSASAGGQRLFVLSAPGEPSDTGAQLLSTLAEAHGSTALFAGAHLGAEEISFALTHLKPDALLIHGSLVETQPEIEALLARLRSGGLWPQVQLAVVGSVCERPPHGADLAAQGPLEILELLALCSEHRAKTGVPLTPTQSALPAHEAPRSRVLHFPSRMNLN